MRTTASSSPVLRRSYLGSLARRIREAGVRADRDPADARDDQRPYGARPRRLSHSQHEAGVCARSSRALGPRPTQQRLQHGRRSCFCLHRGSADATQFGSGAISPGRWPGARAARPRRRRAGSSRTSTDRPTPSRRSGPAASRPAGRRLDYELTPLEGSGHSPRANGALSSRQTVPVGGSAPVRK
jgi:hypothetical protein